MHVRYNFSSMPPQGSAAVYAAHLHRLLAGGLTLSLLVAGCGGARLGSPTLSAATAPAPTGATAVFSPAPAGAIRFVAPGGPAQLEAYTRLAAEYTQAHPGESVDMAALPGRGDYRDRLRADFAAGSAADVMIVDYLDFPGLMARGLFMPVAPYLDASTAIREADFYPRVVSPFR